MNKLNIALNIKKEEIDLIVGQIINDDDEVNNLLVHLLDSKNYNKKLNIFIRSKGGSISTMQELLFAFKNYKNITTYLLSNAYSASSFLFLAGKERIVDEFSIFMAHPPRFEIYSESHRFQNKVEAKIKSLEKIAKTLYKPYLTEKEINEILYEGKEFYFNAEEMLKRGIATKII